jgi:lantibiotic modifying enzyme
MPHGIGEVIEMIVDRAKIDRHGVYWPLGVNYRQTDAALFETSLGFGSPGIVLALLEYYRKTQDAEIAELLQRGLAWISHRADQAPLRHGFYAGTAGLWYLFRDVDSLFPGLVGDWKQRARTLLAEETQGDLRSNLTTGVAGTLVGALGFLDLLPDEEIALLHPLLDRLVAGTKLLPEGVFWDFSPTSLCPPVSFVQGNAGIEYCLAKVRPRLRRSYSTLLLGSFDYAESLFDEKIGNWPDQDAACQLKQLNQAEVEKQILKGRIEKHIGSVQAEDSINWGTGVLGILLSRALLASAYANEPVGSRALADCGHAVRRLSRASVHDLAKLDSSLLYGLSGIVLGLETCRSLLPEAEVAALQPIGEQARALLSERIPVVEGDDMSLLSGVAGLAYAKLRMVSVEARPTCLHPLSAISVGRESGMAVEGNLSPMLARRLPASALVPEVRAALATTAVSLRVVSAAVVKHCQDDPNSVVTKSIRHELGLFEALAEIRFQPLFWREIEKRARFARNYAEGMDDALLFERFRIDDTVTLLDLEYDPYTRADLPKAGHLLLLRQATSNGLVEGKLSLLQHALLTAFASGGVALEVIQKVIRRVETHNVTQRQLADLSLKMVRGFINAGYIVPQSHNALESWLVRKRLKTMRNNLFPVAKS